MTATRRAVVRCRCSHAEGAHWTDRHGRVNCIYPCGCADYRPVKA
jgi:hypothetical protein